MTRQAERGGLLDRVAALERQGLGADRISRKLGIPKGTVQDYLKRVRGTYRTAHSRRTHARRYAVLCYDVSRRADQRVAHARTRAVAEAIAAKLNAEALRGIDRATATDRELLARPLYYVNHEMVEITEGDAS